MPGKFQEGAQSPRRVRGRLQRQQAIQARLVGYTWQQVAQMTGYASAGAAYNAVHLELAKATQAGADELRQIEGARLDALQVPLWPAAISGDRDAIETILRIMSRRARLFGLDLQVPDTSTQLAAGGIFVIQVEGMEEARDIRELTDEELQVYGGHLKALQPGGPAALNDVGITSVTPDTVEDSENLVEGEVISEE